MALNMENMNQRRADERKVFLMTDGFILPQKAYCKVLKKGKHLVKFPVQNRGLGSRTYGKFHKVDIFIIEPFHFILFYSISIKYPELDLNSMQKKKKW
jgi:hypothetical protein